MKRKKTTREKQAEILRVLCDRFELSLIALHSPNRTGCSCGIAQCHSAGKHPLEKNWKASALRSSALAVRILAGKNVGVVCGNGLLVLDVDNKNDGGLSLSELEKEYGTLPATLTVETGNGFHYYFKTEESVPNSVGLVGDGIDIRSDGGYVVAPPSIHANGRTYAFTTSPPADIETAPQWLVDLATRRKDLPAKVGKVTSGMRNKHLTSIGGMSAKNGLSEKAIFHLLMSANREQCNPPLEEGEVRSIAKSVARYSAGTDEEWRSDLVLNHRSEVVKNEANCQLIFLESPIFKDCLQFDRFTGKGQWIVQPNSRFLSYRLGPDVKIGTDFIECQRIMAREFGVSFPKNMVIDGLSAALKVQSHDSLEDHINGLKVNKRSKVNLDNWTQVCLGAKDSSYNRMVGRKFLVGMAARALRPGCKMDNMLVLESVRQGIGKSTAASILGGPFFYCGNLKPGDKDCLMNMRDTWVFEVGELSGMRKAKVEAVKQFVSDTSDTYREPYARDSVTVPRRCVFIGTTNELNYLKDSENRRFWPIRLGRKVNTRKLEMERDNLLARAREAFLSGEQWWLDYKEEPVAQAEQAKRAELQVDPWRDHIKEYLMQHPGLDFLTYKQVLRDIGIPVDRMQVWHSKRVASILLSEGWIRGRKNGIRGYVRKKDEHDGNEHVQDVSGEVEPEVPGDAYPDGPTELLPEGNGIP